MEGLSPESVFGGLVLMAVLTLLLGGKLRFEREVQEKDSIIAIKDKTINEQRKTINILLGRAEVTHHLLQELRDAAYGNNKNDTHSIEKIMEMHSSKFSSEGELE